MDGIFGSFLVNRVLGALLLTYEVYLFKVCGLLIFVELAGTICSFDFFAGITVISMFSLPYEFKLSYLFKARKSTWVTEL